MDQRSWHHQNDQPSLPPPPPPRSMEGLHMEGLHEAGPPPFLIKTFEMVDDLGTADIVYWNRGGHSFVVLDHNAFSTTVLPTYFKHNNFSSFVRQLNTYGFRKIDAEKWEFANEAFVRGEKHLLKNIKRRRGPTHPSPSPDPTLVDPCVEIGQFGQEAEVDRLRRDKQVLTTELIKLRQQNQNTRLYLQQIESRVHGTEKKQKQVMRFLVNAMQNPDFICRLVQHKKKKDRLVQHKEKKDESRSVEDEETNQKDKGLNLVEVGHDGFEVSELEALALEMQGLRKVGDEGRSRDKGVEIEELGHLDKEVLDEGLWGELLNQGFNEAERLMLLNQGFNEAERLLLNQGFNEVERLMLLNQGFNEAERLMMLNQGKNEEGEEEDHHVNVLANRFGFLGSTSGSNI